MVAQGRCARSQAHGGLILALTLLGALLVAPGIHAQIGGSANLAGAVVDEADATPFAAPLQEEDGAPVGVDVHLVGIEPEGAKLQYSSSPRTTTVEPTWSSVGSM